MAAAEQGREAEATPVKARLRQYAFLCIDRCEGNSYSWRSLLGALRHAKQRFDHLKLKRQLQACLMNIAKDMQESEKRRQGALNMLQRVKEEAVYVTRPRRPVAGARIIYNTNTKYQKCPIQGIAGPISGGSSSIAIAAGATAENQQARDASAEQTQATNPALGGSQVTPQGCMGEDAVAEDGASRALTSMSPIVQGRKAMFGQAPSFEDAQSVAKGKKTAQRRTPNVALSSDALCNMGSPLLPSGESRFGGNGSEAGRADRQLSSARAEVAGGSAQQRRGSATKRHWEVDHKTSFGAEMSAEMSIEPPAAKREVERYFEVREMLLQLEREYPHLSAQLTKLPPPQATAGPATHDAAAGASKALSSHPPSPGSLGTAMPKKLGSPLKALAQRNATTSVESPAFAWTSLPLLNNEAEAGPSKRASASQGEETRAGEKDEAGKKAGAATGKSFQNKRMGAKETPQAQNAATQSASFLDFPGSQAVVEKDEGTCQGLALQKERTVLEVGRKAGSGPSLSEGERGAADADEEKVSNTQQALAAVKLLDQLELEAKSALQFSKGDSQTLRAPMQAPSAALKQLGEGACFFQNEQGADSSRPQVINRFGSSLAAPYRETASVAASGRTDFLSRSHEDGLQRISRLKRTQSRKLTLSNSLFKAGRVSATVDQDDDDEYADKDGLDGVFWKSGQGSQSFEKCEGGEAGPNEGSEKLKGVSFGNQFSFNEDDKDEEPFGGVLRPSSQGTSRAGESKKGKAIEAPQAAGTSDDGGQNLGIETSMGKNCGMKTKDAAKQSRSSVSVEFGPFINGATIFRTRSAGGENPFESFDKKLDRIQAQTDFTFGLEPPGELQEDFFKTHCASPNINPFKPRDLLFQDQSSNGVAKSVNTVPAPNRNPSQNSSRLYASAPGELAILKLSVVSETEDEEERSLDISNKHEETAPPVGGNSWGKANRGERASEASEGNTELQRDSVNRSLSADVTQESDHLEGRKGGRLLRAATRDFAGHEENVSKDGTEKKGGAWEQRSIDGVIGRYDNIEQSPLSSYKQASGRPSRFLSSSQESPGEHWRRGFGQSPLGVPHRSSCSEAALTSYESEESPPAARRSGLQSPTPSESESESALVAQIAILLQKEQQIALLLQKEQQASDDSDSPSEENPLDWEENQSMEISGYGQGNEDSDEEDETAQSALMGLASEEKSGEEQVSAESAGAVMKSAAATREGNFEVEAAQAQAHSEEQSEEASPQKASAAEGAGRTEGEHNESAALAGDGGS